jgi:hypothetical protein
LDNTPIVLTNPGIWEALGLPVTPFLDSEIAGRDFKKIREQDIQPYQVARVALVDAATNEPILDSSGKAVYFEGTNPIDVPNCSNCHSNDNVNGQHPEIFSRVKAEVEYWKSAGAADWFAHQKATSISILSLHDKRHGTRFTEKYNPDVSSNRLGRGAVLCQKCHADNVIGVIGGGTVTHRNDGTVVVEDRARIDLAVNRGASIEFLNPQNPDTPVDGTLVPPLTEAIHGMHIKIRPLPDGQMRSGSCQGCHPAHRQDRSMEGYPITADGLNAFSGAPGSAGNDNRDAAGGCFVNRDVHSNPAKDTDGAETPEYLNSIGAWIKMNVSRQDGKMKGLWCTNCHTELSKELYKHDHLEPGEAFQPHPDHTLRSRSLNDIAHALGLIPDQISDHLDPKVVLDEEGRDIGSTTGAWKTAQQGRENAWIGVIATDGGQPVINRDEDGDASVKLLSMNPDEADRFSSEKGVTASYDAATQGRDYWLSPGVPHCSDCRLPPFVEGQGGVAYPINQPGKYSSMRYSKGHAGLACQACHESIHGLYPVTPDVDRTTYMQAAQLNPDGSHGPLKCQTCHEYVNRKGVPFLASRLQYEGRDITGSYNLAVLWIHANAPDIGGETPGLQVKD